MKFHVGHLSFDTTESDLSELFSRHGELADVAVVMDRESGRSRGFGFVEMKDENAARETISALDGKELGGRSLKVNEARPRTDRRGGGGGGGRRDRW